MSSFAFISGRPSFGRGFIGTFRSCVEDVHALTPAELFERRMKKIAQAELKRVREASTQTTQKTARSTSSQEVQPKSDTNTSSGNASVHAETNHSRFEDTIPGALVIDSSETVSSSAGGGGNKGTFPPKKPGGGSFGGRKEYEPYPLKYTAWNIFWVCLSVSLILYLLINDDHAKNAFKGLSYKVEQLASDIEFGANRFNLFSKRLAEAENKTNANTNSLITLAGSVAKHEDSIRQTQDAVNSLASAAAIPEALARNADELANAKKQIASLQKSDQRQNVAVKKLAADTEDAKAGSVEALQAVAQLRAEIATKPQDFSSGARSGLQKNGYRLSSMTFMDGSGQYQKRVEIDKDIYFVPRTEDPMRKVPSYKNLAR